MRLAPLAFALLATLSCAQAAEPITLAQAMADPDWIGPPVEGGWWRWDGKAVQFLVKHPGETYRIDTHQRTHGTAYQTARADLLGLADHGLLESDRSGRALLFVAPGDLKVRIASLAG